MTTTNSVDKVLEVNKNFNNIISEIKQSIPSIQTEKIEAIKIVQSDIPNAPQKIIVLFQSEKDNEKSQVAVVDQPDQGKPVIVDVQTILPEEDTSAPEPIRPVKLSPQEIKTEKVEDIIKTNIK